ncbi:MULTISPECIES: SMP-30/gluconolactonase/LRE family protein [Microbacterium]|uniref:SMP-30/gluconolactonase/LRE family protein n=1 Tax=Microbacterium TaxID=33882 RepID=UPI00146CFB8E|nr:MULTISPECIES: SMP-30/gluconolactonase/LRE family protein [Microbacterium]
MIETTIAVRRRAQCGEGPVWDAERDEVLWVDIVSGEILRTARTTGSTAARSHDAMVGAVTLRADGGLVAAVATGFIGWDAAGDQDRRLDCLPAGTRMNDAKVDPSGRFWAGDCAIDFTPGAGGLWVLDHEWNARRVLEGFTLPNGLDWSPGRESFYLVESMGRKVFRFDWDVDRGEISGAAEVLIGSEAFTGLPDGLCVDARGHLWIAEYGGTGLHEFAPTGERVRTIAIPTAQPTSCAFVGPDLDELWVTSAAAGQDGDPDAGSIFRLRGLGATGLPSTRFGG